MMSELELPVAVQLVLLPVLQAVKKSIAEGEFQTDPRVDCRIRRASAGHENKVTIVTR